MRSLAFLMLAATLAVPASAQASDPEPEIERKPAAPQQTGVLHALRTIPEACARLQGRFIDDPSEPYRFDVVRTSTACRPRARLLKAETAKPSAATGWILNDLIRVPSAACPSQEAVVQVWRHPAASSASPQLDAQGKARIYLGDLKRKAGEGKLAAVPAYAVAMSLEGKRCGT
ncbi:MAG: hypothetical protein M3Y70_07855 [Pseudomonadota bacterium]|nr:hypothetical protein [Pseudomonadota bacterium]